jgi:putative transposase
MARPLRIQYPGAFYHVTCRGNKRQKIFLDNDDRHWFLKVLCESLEIYQVVLYCYILMDNHFHLVMQTLRANLSEFMRRFNISYTSWFNYHHNTCGHVYQGRYKAFLVDADKYLLGVSRYIHLNPVRKSSFKKLACENQLEHINRCYWSSLPGYLNKKKIVDFVDYDMILDMVSDRCAYRRFLLDGLQDGIEDPFENVQYQTILGDDNFVSRVKGEYLELGSLREQPEYREIMAREINPETIVGCIVSVLRISLEEIHTRHGRGFVRGIVSDLLYRYSGMTQHAIGRYLGVDYSSVYKLRSRLKKRMEYDSDLVRKYKNVVDAIKRELSNV